MIDLYLLFTALFCIGAFLGVWVRYKDPLHPFIISCPLLFAAYVWMPYTALSDENVIHLIPREQFPVVLLVNLCFVGAYICGCAVQTARIRHANEIMPVGLSLGFFRMHKRKVEAMVAFLALYAQLGYWSGIQNVGGFLRAYGRAKGGGHASSGYLGEASLAAYPAFLLFAISCRGKKFSVLHPLLGLLIISPNLLHAVFGGRRGPMFVTLMIIALGLLLSRARRPSLGGIVAVLAAAFVLMVFVGSQRRTVYLGSGEKLELGRFVEYLQEERGSKGGTFTTSSGSILTTMKTGKYYWGRRYFVTYLIRPIPRQLLPGKVSIYAWGSGGGIEDKDWSQVMGWVPEEGYATGFVADIFAECSWWGVVIAFLYGALHGAVWRLARSRGGVWLIELGLLLALLIYVPSQSVSAFLHRFIFMGFLTWVAWHFILGREWNRWFQTCVVSPDGPDAAGVSREGSYCDPGMEEGPLL